MARWNLGAVEEAQGNAVFILWVALVTLTLISAIVIFCADGAKDKAQATDTYGGTCTAAGCGATCGG
ncbi:hypothetical protein Acr_00g0024810 [Actinidia rufa]|uniref:Uncharacterized protein n=1 Tax=Actinidia rufa TaxID=165716 RepID=A0A7J0DD72_9ERIC|nr:hypothetical protein Acr_00g0024810 [Actinidia rufa]